METAKRNSESKEEQKGIAEESKIGLQNRGALFLMEDNVFLSAKIMKKIHLGPFLSQDIS